MENFGVNAVGISITVRNKRRDKVVEGENRKGREDTGEKEGSRGRV